jgi:hypothetical protein
MSAPTYSVYGHDLLSEQAAALRAEEIDAHQVAAEELLGVAGTSFTDDDLVKVKVAIVRQVNLQVSAPSIFGISRERKGDHEIEYSASQPGSVAAAPIDPVAEAIVQRLLDNEWATLPSRRS